MNDDLCGNMRIFLLLLPTVFQCAVAEENVEELFPVIVSAPIHKQAAETAHPVNLLEGDELTLKSSATIGETLKQELGVHSMSFGPSVGQPVIRGQSGSRVRQRGRSGPFRAAGGHFELRLRSSGAACIVLPVGLREIEGS